MSSQKLKDLKISGLTYDVHVDEHGTFVGYLGNDRIGAASTLKDLHELLAKDSKRVRKNISIPFVAIDNGKVRKGICTGIHAGNRNYLIKWDGDKTITQENHWQQLYAVPPDKFEELEKLFLAKAAAEATLDEFVNDNYLNLKEEVEKLMQKESEK